MSTFAVEVYLKKFLRIKEGSCVDEKTAYRNKEVRFLVKLSKNESQETLADTNRSAIEASWKEFTSWSRITVLQIYEGVRKSEAYGKMYGTDVPWLRYPSSSSNSSR